MGHSTATKDSFLSEISPLPVYLAFLGLGFYSLNVQSLLFREFLVVFYGSELAAGIFLGSWLAAVASGSWLYSRLNLNKIKNCFAPGLILLAVLPVFQIFLLRVCRLLLKTPAGSYLPLVTMLIYSFFCLLPFGLLMGMLFPLGCRLLSSQKGKAIARLYIMESLGFLLGGLLFSFYLVEKFPPFPQLGWGIGILCFLSSWLWIAQKKISPKILPLIFITICLLIFPLNQMLARAEKITLQLRWQGLNPGLPLLKSLDSRYQNLALTRQAELYSLYGNGQYYFSFPDPAGEESLSALIYTQHPNPQKILLIGDASPGLIKEFLKFPLKSLDWVLLDNRLQELTADFLTPEQKQAFQDPRLLIHYRDARLWLKNQAGLYDLIILSLPDPQNAMLNRFYTLEFFREAKTALLPAGVLALSVSSGENYLGGEVLALAASIYRTLKVVFPFIAISPGEKSFFFAAQNAGSVSEDPGLLLNRLKKANLEFTHFYPPPVKNLLPA